MNIRLSGDSFAAVVKDSDNFHHVPRKYQSEQLPANQSFRKGLIHWLGTYKCVFFFAHFTKVVMGKYQQRTVR